MEKSTTFLLAGIVFHKSTPISEPNLLTSSVNRVLSPPSVNRVHSTPQGSGSTGFFSEPGSLTTQRSGSTSYTVNRVHSTPQSSSTGFFSEPSSLDSSGIWMQQSSSEPGSLATQGSGSTGSFSEPGSLATQGSNSTGFFSEPGSLDSSGIRLHRLLQ